MKNTQIKQIVDHIIAKVDEGSCNTGIMEDVVDFYYSPDIAIPK